MIFAMTKNVWTVLLPLLVINYVFGFKIIEFPTGQPRLWFSLLYIMFSWSFYFLLWYTTMSSIMSHFSNIHHIFQALNDFIALLSIAFGIYYDKKFKNCLRKLTIVDITLEKLGIMINYQQLRMRTVRLVLGWFAIVLLTNYVQFLYVKYHFKYNTITSIYFVFMATYCFHINFISDLTMASVLGYIEKKFDQINEHLLDIASIDNHKTQQTRKNLMLHLTQHRALKISSNEWIIWTIMHLHLELCKISREIDWIFGVQMTIKMGCYSSFIAVNLNDFFDLIFYKKYILSLNNILFTSICLICIFYNILKLFIINYMCEKVSAKANATKNFVNRVSYTTRNIEMFENISQLLLQLTRSSLRFYGIGLFQFGFKFLQRFTTSVMTVVVLLIQSQINKNI